MTSSPSHDPKSIYINKGGGGGGFESKTRDYADFTTKNTCEKKIY